MAHLGTLLNDNHRRVLGSGLAHLDDRLAAIGTMASGAATRSPFSPYAPDLSAAEVYLLHDYVAEIRSRMAEMASALDLDVAHGNIPTSRAVEVTLLSAQIDLAELCAENLRGYGPLGSEGAAAVEQFMAELCRFMHRAREIVVRGTAAELSNRIAHIDHAAVDLAGLAALERVIRRHGLVTLREPLDALVERIERRSFEICIFGRVNAGKSSLLNAVLDTTALPVGVTPVTAVPTRIVFGPAEEASIDIRNGERMLVPLSRLREFVSEEENGDNHKDVTAVCVRLPSRYLADGIAFVDTPGVGSLATAGARESYRYLPRADLGILLVDASTPPMREDIEVLRLLDASAIPSMAVLTKTDLLSNTDLERVRRHARAQISGALGRDVALHAVSLHGTSAVRARTWFAEVIAPLCARGRTLAEESARRRFVSLIAAALEAVRAETSPGEADPARYEELETLAATADRRVRDTRIRCEDIAYRLRASLPEVFDAAANVAAHHIVADDDGSVVGAAAEAALETAAGRDCDAVQQELLRLRHDLQELLTRACALAGARAIPDVLQMDFVGRPRAAVPAEIRAVAFTPSRWLQLSKRLLQKRIVQILHARLERAAADVLAQLAAELRTWSGRVLDTHRRQFGAQIDPLRIVERGRVRPVAGATRTLTDADSRDIETLERLAASITESHEQLPDHRSVSSREATRCSPGR